MSKSNGLSNIINTYSVPTISDLKDVNNVYDGIHANVLGYYEIGDGGGGSFYYDATATDTDNGGTIIVPNSGTGRWFRLNADTVSAKQFGAKGDGVTDDTTFLQNMFDSDARSFEFEFGSYNVTSEVLVTKSVTINGNNSSIINTSSTGYGLRFTGSTTELSQPLTDINEGDKTILFTDSETLEKGQWLCVHNQVDYSFSSHRAEYQAGEFVKIYWSGSGTQPSTLQEIFGVFQNNYTASASLKVFKYDGLDITIDNLNFGTGVNDDPALFIEFATKVVLNNCTGTSSYYTSIQISKSVNVTITNTDATTRDTSGVDVYGISCANCTNVRVIGNDLAASNHALAIGGTTGDCAIPNRNYYIYGCSLYTESDVGLGASDMHGNCDNITYDSCTMLTGANMAGKNVKYNNCKIFSRYSDGNCLYGSEVVGGYFNVKGCEFFSSGASATFPIIYLSTDTNTDEDLTVNITDIYVYAEQASNGTVVAVRQNNTSTKTNVKIDGLTVDNPDNSIIIISYPRDVGAATYNADFHIVDNVYCTDNSVNGIELMKSDATTTNLPLRLQRQCGSADVTTSISANTATTVADIAFNYKYPKTPVTSVSKVGTAYIGSDAPVPYVVTNDRDAIRVGVSTTDTSNFDAATSVTLHWSAEISEV